MYVRSFIRGGGGGGGGLCIITGYVTTFLDFFPHFQSFLSDLCEIEDFHETLQLEEYIALCRQDIAIDITVQEMACLHTLLLKYRQDIVSPHNTVNLEIFVVNIFS